MSDLISGNLSDDLKNSWGTDPLVVDAMDDEFHFDLDAAASHKNKKFNQYLTIEDDALSVDWSLVKRLDGGGGRVKAVWINPPYGRGFINKFMQKCIEQKVKGVTSVMLVPATLDARWLPIDDISEIRIITGGRLSFFCPISDQKINGNTKGSMFVIFRPSKIPLNIKLIDRDELLGVDGE